MAARNRPAAKQESENLFLMGTDPEIVFLDQDKRIIPASRYLRTHNHPDPLGCDGHAYIAELRPGPGTPEQLCKNIEQILKQYRDKLPKEAKWWAGSFVADRPIGGHIHWNLKYQDQYGDILDGVLSQILTLLEDRDQAIRRRAGNYGGLKCYNPDAIRYPPHGFEYRTPASFIVSPSVSLGVFALAKAIMYEEVTEGTLMLRKLKGDYLKAVTKIDADRYRNADREYFQLKLPTIWSIVEGYRFWQTAEGKRLWKYTAQLKQLIDLGSWDNGLDILERWKVVKKPAGKRVQVSAAAGSKILVPEGLVDPANLWRILADAPLRQVQEAPELAQPRLGAIEEDLRLPPNPNIRWGDLNLTALEPFVIRP